MKDSALESTIEEICQRNSNATFLVAGDSLKGDIAAIGCPESAKFIFSRDYMAVGRGAPEILSPEFIAMRAEAFNNPFYEPYTIEEYERDCVSPLRSLSERKNTEIYLIQYDCYSSQIWQLTMQAYIEQLGIAEKVTRICFGVNTEPDCQIEFFVSGINEIPVSGSHDAYCKLVCSHISCELSDYFISEEAVRCYLDIDSPDGILRNYIRKTSSTYKSPYPAVGRFLLDFQKWGLGDGEFLKIAHETFSQDPKYAKKLKKWKEVMAEQHRKYEEMNNFECSEMEE